MNEQMKSIVAILVFLVSLMLVIVGQKNLGYQGLAMELVGLVGLIGCLWAYNRKYK